jgi:hypothetical protein
VTKTNFLQYIQQQTRLLSHKQYTDPRQQALYELGLTQAILAECMYSDNLSAGIFQKRIRAVLDRIE